MKSTSKSLSFEEMTAALRRLDKIPGVGASIAMDLYNVGITRVSDLKGRSPEALFSRLEKHIGARVDRCVLYVFRCAVYFAETRRPEPSLLKWWNWKDRATRSPGRARSRR